MKAALDRALTLSNSDPLAARLAGSLSQHIPEETNHDDWLLDDLAVLGIDRTELLKRMPPPDVATLVGSQYYSIFHFHPVALLGYIAVLEGTPPDIEHVKSMATKSGVPIEAFSTMLKHSRLDPYHRDDLDRTLDGLPLTLGHSALLGVSAFHTVHWLSRVIEDAIRQSELPVA